MISGFCFTRFLVVSVHKSTVVTHSTSGGVFNFELKTLTCMLKGVNKLSLKWLPQEKCFQLQKKKEFTCTCIYYFSLSCIWSHQLQKKKWSHYLLLICSGCCVISLLLSSTTLSCHRAHGASSLCLSHGVSCSRTGRSLRLGCGGCL